MIDIKNASLKFGKKQILDNVSYTVKKNDISVILGPSGAGKSSLLKIILGLWKIDSGEVKVNGINITKMNEKGLFQIRKKMAMVFQSNALFDSLNVEQNISYFLRENNQCSEKEIKLKVEECLSFVNLEGIEKLFPDELSGGMKKRVAIARAIASNPDIVLFDEPTTGLDSINSKAIRELIVKMKENGATSVVVTHIVGDAIAIGDDLTLMNGGKIILNGTINDMLISKDNFVQEFFAEIYHDVSKLSNLVNLMN
jgi:phospholipid/cholesterol/gamma-HCH transport system ATP-binding protein